jgi:1-phosphofructokinase family hexose kinase
VITVLLLSPSLDVTHLVESVEPGAIHRPRTVLRAAGGKGLNLARAARVLGGDVHVVAPLGGGMGDVVAALAAEEGIPLARVPVAAETRSCLTVVADSGPGIEFYEPATGITPHETAAVGRTLAAAPLGGWTVLSGSVPAGVEHAVVGMMRVRVAAGERIAVDTHGDALRAIVDARLAALVKVNRSEAAELLGAADDVRAIDLARDLQSRAGGTVVVTDGVEGSACVSAEEAWIVKPHGSPGRFAVGSGDSFLAGFLVGIERGSSLEESIALASATASANAMRPGAAVIDPEDVASERRSCAPTPLRHSF